MLKLSVLLLATLAWAAPSAVDSHLTKDGKVKPIKWSKCADNPKFQCAYYDVPMSYDKKNPLNKKKVSLFVRKRSSGKKNTQTFFVNPGGPGGSGSAFVASWGFEYALEPYLDFDFISWDPRGVNMTTPPIGCYDTPEAAYGASNAGNFYGLPIDYRSGALGTNSVSKKNYQSTTLTWYRNALSLAQGTSQACSKSGDIDMLRSVSTALTARDLDTLRQAVGMDKMNYLGYSYGTALGSTYAAMFPDRVGRFVLDGNVNVEQNTNDLVSMTRNALVDSNAGLQTFFEYCAEAGKLCALNDMGQTPRATSKTSAQMLRARWDAMLQSLADSPLPMDVGSMTSSTLLGMWQGNAYSVIGWLGFAERVAGIEAAIALRLPIVTGQWSFPEFGNWTKNVFHRYMDDKGVLGDSSLAAIRCGDAKPYSVNSKSFQEWGWEGSKIAYTGEAWSVSAAQCGDWPFQQTEAYRKWNGLAKTSTGMYVGLFIGNTEDPVTPLASAQSNSARFPGSSVLIQNSAGHCSLRQKSACRTSIVRKYLETGILPKTGTLCQLDHPNPFTDTEIITLHKQGLINGMFASVRI